MLERLKRIVTLVVCALRHHPAAVPMAQDYELFLDCPTCGRLPGVQMNRPGDLRVRTAMAGDPAGPKVAVGSLFDPQLSPAGTRRLLAAIAEHDDPEPEDRWPIFTELDWREIDFNRFGGGGNR